MIWILQMSFKFSVLFKFFISAFYVPDALGIWFPIIRYKICSCFSSENLMTARYRSDRSSTWILPQMFSPWLMYAAWTFFFDNINSKEKIIKKSNSIFSPIPFKDNNSVIFSTYSQSQIVNLTKIIEEMNQSNENRKVIKAYKSKLKSKFYRIMKKLNINYFINVVFLIVEELFLLLVG